MNTKPNAGRPSKNDEFKLYDTPLYRLLVEKLPSEFVKFGRLDTLKLSEAIGCARFTIYCWFDKRPPSRKAIHALLKISNETDEVEKKGALTTEDLVLIALGL